MLNLAEKEGEGRAEEVTMVEVRVFKLVAGDSAMKDGEASGLEDEGEKDWVLAMELLTGLGGGMEGRLGAKHWSQSYYWLLLRHHNN